MNQYTHESIYSRVDTHMQTNVPSSVTTMMAVAQEHVVQTKYQTWICLHSSRMNGTVRIHKRRDCNEKLNFSKDPRYTKLIRDQFGPDEFVLGLEGPELHSLTLNVFFCDEN